MEKQIYKGLDKIGERLEISAKLARAMITRKIDPLPAKRVGRAYWITELKIREWLNN